MDTKKWVCCITQSLLLQASLASLNPPVTWNRFVEVVIPWCPKNPCLLRLVSWTWTFSNSKKTCLAFFTGHLFGQDASNRIRLAQKSTHSENRVLRAKCDLAPRQSCPQCDLPAGRFKPLFFGTLGGCKYFGIKCQFGLEEVPNTSELGKPQKNLVPNPLRTHFRDVFLDEKTMVPTAFFHTPL